MARVLVTGGAGFIGSHLAARLVERGDEVVVLDDLTTGNLENLKPLMDGLKFVKGDVRDASVIEHALGGCDYVLHQAGLASVPKSFTRPHDFYDVNVKGLYTLLSGAARLGIKRVLLASSSSVYGDCPDLPQREGQEGVCLSPYALSKKAAEDLAKHFWKTHGLETVSLRYFNVFGPRQNPSGPYAAVIPKFIAALGVGERPTIFGGGDQTRDFTYVYNVVEANLRAMTAPAGQVAGQVFNVALGKPTSVNALYQEIARLMGKDAAPLYAPARKGDIPHSRADVSKAVQAFGLCEVVDIKEGLRRTVQSFGPAQGSKQPGT